MNNGWRDALMTIWILLLVGAVGLVVAAVIIGGRAAQSDSVLGTTSSFTEAGLFFSGATLCGSIGVTVLVLWITVSAVVREHQKDRDVILRGRE
jgi:hypothetical protein